MVFNHIRDLGVSAVGRVVQSRSSVMICYIDAAHQRQKSFSAPQRSIRDGHMQRRLTAEPTPGLDLWPPSQQHPHCPLKRTERITCRKSREYRIKKVDWRKTKCSHIVPGSCGTMQWSQTRLVLSINMSTWNKRRTRWYHYRRVLPRFSLQELYQLHKKNGNNFLKCST